LSPKALVLDASTAVFLSLMDVPWSGLDRYTFHAPPLMWSEALSGLSQAAHRGQLSTANLERAVRRLEALPVAASDADANHRRSALEIARQLGWAKTYDAEYVALANTLGCSLLTVDLRLQRGAERVIDVVGPSDV
jgi:predicted nucleic acid-binding protein